MTVDELRQKLDGLPGNMKVVVRRNKHNAFDDSAEFYVGRFRKDAEDFEACEFEEDWDKMDPNAVCIY